jgi:alpha-tubulin suppressor-like RCC1 family protein
MGIDYTGQVWTWGYNVYGQLGNNTAASRCTPVSVMGAKKTFCNISSGFYHSTGIDNGGLVWCWGYNQSGQLGDYTISSRRTPVSVLGAKKTFCKISAGKNYTTAIDKNGIVWVWGYNDKGQLGDNTVVSRCTPVSILGARKTFCRITAGDTHTFGIDKNGLAWGWGYNAYGQLGDNTTVSRCTPVSILGARKTFCKIETGITHTIGLDSSGKLWGWGIIVNLGVGGFTTIPYRAHGQHIFSYISAGFNHSAGIDSTGQVWTWGSNSSGQLGVNSIISKRTPVSILGAKKTFCKIIARATQNIGLDKNGLVWTWGYNLNGQLGDNTVVSRCTPVSILGARKTFCQIFGGGYSTYGIDYSGQVWTWGLNHTGQLGDNTLTDRCTPVSILGIKKTFCQITSGTYDAAAIDRNGQVWTWGINLNGRLGDNTTVSRCTPVSILGTKKTFCKISCGGGYSMGIDYTGQVWSWGENLYGQLGNDSIADKCTPVSILGTKKTFCEISAGTYHAAGIDSNGRLWTWGYNSFGQLGDNTNSSRSTPALIYINKTFCRIFCGNNFTLGIDNVGAAWGWGYNTNGQLGYVNPLTPIAICL